MGLLFRLGLVLFLLMGLSAAGLYVAAQQRPSAVVGMPAISPNAGDAASLDAKIAALESQLAQAARSSAHVSVSITFTEQELTSKVAEFLASQPNNPLHPTNVQVHLRGGNVVLNTTIQAQGLSLNVAVTATPQAVNGSLKLSVQSVDTGAIALPDFVKQQLNAALAPALDPSALGLPLDVTSVVVGNGQLTLNGVTK